ncbi:MAG TPA: YbaK/EbsC family protein [Firmicutes bacterium]|nr:YbaK/EbsC family protein [Bacillota bacterium]
MATSLKKSAEKVQTTLNELGFELNVVELSDSARTAQEAANALGCTIGQIAKSLVFKGKTSHKPVLIIASGTNRVNEKAMKYHVGEDLEKAEARFVYEQTGFAIGGIPPVGHKTPIMTFIDEDLMQYEEIWAAAGTPHSVFKLTPKILAEVTQGKIVSIK